MGNAKAICLNTYRSQCNLQFYCLCACALCSSPKSLLCGRCTSYSRTFLKEKVKTNYEEFSLIEGQIETKCLLPMHSVRLEPNSFPHNMSDWNQQCQTETKLLPPHHVRLEPPSFRFHYFNPLASETDSAAAFMIRSQSLQHCQVSFHLVCVLFSPAKFRALQTICDSSDFYCQGQMATIRWLTSLVATVVDNYVQ